MAIVWLIVLIVVLLVVATYAWGAWRAAPYVPTRQKDVERMLRLAHVQPGEVVYDLGAGDGRFVLTAAKDFQAKATGFEISLLPYIIAKLRLLLAGQSMKTMQFKDFYGINLSAADVVICFLTPGAMKKLSGKITSEMKPGSRLLSYAFAVPGWEPTLKDKPTKNTMAVYLYQR